MLLHALKKSFEADVAEHSAVIDIYLQKPVGIGEHGDVLTEAEKELKIIAEYDDQLEMLNKYFVVKDPFKG